MEYVIEVEVILEFLISLSASLQYSEGSEVIKSFLTQQKTGRGTYSIKDFNISVSNVTICL